MSATVPCYPPLFRGRMKAAEADELAAAFRALADPARLRVLSFIAARPGAEACVCDLVGVVGLSQPTVSHHLKVLHEAGFLNREKRGTWVYYRVNRPRLDSIQAALVTPHRRPATARLQATKPQPLAR